MEFTMHEATHIRTSVSSVNALRRIGRYWRWWLPDLAGVLLAMLLCIPLFEWTNLDLAITRLFYYGWRHWPFFLNESPPWNWIYRFVAAPLILVALGAVIVIVAGYFHSRLRSFRDHGYYILLALALGPGLVVNAVLKEHWGRPRPLHVREFGGRAEFRKALHKGAAHDNKKSFPCGHSSVGYYLSVFYFIFRRRQRRLSWLCLLLALLSGTVIGYGRIMAGSHFTSDVVWSGILVFLVNGLLYYVVLNIPWREDYPLAPGCIRSWRAYCWGMARVGALFCAITLGALLATPTDQHILRGTRPFLNRPNPPEQIHVRCSHGDIDLVFGKTESFVVEGEAQGFGWFGNRIEWKLTADEQARRVDFILDRRGFYMEYHARLEVSCPNLTNCVLYLHVEHGDIRVTKPIYPPPPIRIHLGKGAISLPAGWLAHDVQVDAPPDSLQLLPP